MTLRSSVQTKRCAENTLRIKCNAEARVCAVGIYTVDRTESQQHDARVGVCGSTKANHNSYRDVCIRSEHMISQQKGKCVEWSSTRLAVYTAKKTTVHHLAVCTITKSDGTTGGVERGGDANGKVSGV